MMANSSHDTMTSSCPTPALDKILAASEMAENKVEQPLSPPPPPPPRKYRKAKVKDNDDSCSSGLGEFNPDSLSEFREMSMAGRRRPPGIGRIRAENKSVL